MTELIDGSITPAEVEKPKEIPNLNLLLILRRSRINLGNRELMGSCLGPSTAALVSEGPEDKHLSASLGLPGD